MSRPVGSAWQPLADADPVPGDPTEVTRLAGQLRGFWDRIKHGFTNWVRQNAGWIRKLTEIAGWAATILGVLALVVNLIPIVGQALAAIFTALALIATVVALVGHLTLALGGVGSWVDVGLDVVALATFGIGRAAVAGTRVGAGALRGSGKLAVVAERLGARITARGGTFGTDTLRALMHGDWGAAQASSGVSRSLLRGWTGELFGGATRELGGFGQKATRAAMDAVPAHAVPSPAQILSGFSPKALVSETADGVRTLASKQAWKDGWQLARGGHFNVSGLDSGTLTEVRQAVGAADHVRVADLVRPYRAAMGGELKVFYGSTGVGTAVDWSDKFHLFDWAK